MSRRTLTRSEFVRESSFLAAGTLLACHGISQAAEKKPENSHNAGKSPRIQDFQDYVLNLKTPTFRTSKPGIS